MQHSRRLKKGKPLILRNRRYSSWTYDLNAAKDFGNYKFSDYWVSSGYVLIILRRHFQDNEILLNIVKAIPTPTSEMRREKEIIVKNVNENFTFKPKEIILYRINSKNSEYIPF